MELTIPSIVKNSAQCACKNILPNLSDLKKRGMWGMTREECRNGFATSGHVLWGCSLQVCVGYLGIGSFFWC